MQSTFCFTENTTSTEAKEDVTQLTSHACVWKMTLAKWGKNWKRYNTK
jgi:hypothetical protein